VEADDAPMQFDVLSRDSQPRALDAAVADELGGDEFLPPASPMDLPISRPDRIRRLLRNIAAGDALRVHA
jgi:hypothetical protein